MTSFEMVDKKQNVYINPNGKHNYYDDGSDNEEGDNPKPQGIVRIISKFADKCSVSGIPFIRQAENKVVKVIWSCLLIAAFGFMTYHLYSLGETYLAYKKQTQVQLSFSNLQFPAVTICNVNPLRMSKSDLASSEVTEFIDSVDPAVVKGILETWEPDLDDLDDGYYEDIEAFDEYLQEETDGVTMETFLEYKQAREKRQSSNEYQERRKKRQSGSTTNEKNRIKSGTKKQKSEKVRSNNFFDEIDIAEDIELEEAIDAFFEEYEESGWEAESDTSGFYELEMKFRRLFVKELSSTRAKMGHQINDMMLQCSFAGRKCVARNFTRFLSTQFGNCYTLQYPKFVSRKSGPTEGLQLQLFLETDDYLPGIANSKGIQVVIHDQGTLPFPGEEGLAVKAGTETFIGLRRMEISRLGYPWGKCTPVKDFDKKYGFKYTRNACQRVCRQERIQKKCACYDSMQQEVNRVLKRPKSLQPCQTPKEIQCALKINAHFDREKDLCGCYRPCTETTFQKTVTARNWPNPAYATLLSSAACKHNSSVCDDLPSKDESELREEFVKLVIYYEDLNYEELTELAAYKLSQFLSDVGGTIGLWIGLSLLSVFEIIHLIADISLHICCRNGNRKQK